MPEWLFNESYQTVGDLAETIALLLPEPSEPVDNSKFSLSEILETLSRLSDKSEDEKKSLVLSLWQSFDRNTCFVFNKLITGGFRIGVSNNMIHKAVALTENMEQGEVAYRLSGKWHPSTHDYLQLLKEEHIAADISKPYPFYLAHPLETQPSELGEIGRAHV